jgi:two-component system cell cycle response regulator
MVSLQPRQAAMVRAGAVVLALGFALFAAHAAFFPDGGAIFNTWLYCGLLLGASASCFLRAHLVRRERLAWASLGVGLLIWTGGEIYFSAVLSGSASVPIPSPADAGYLLFYPFAYAGLILLLRARIGAFPATRWLDGLIAGTAIAAIAAAFALGPIVDAGTEGDTLAVATNLLYPIADLTLLALIVSATAFTGWRPDRRWLALGAGFVILACSDVAYLLESAEGSYVEGGLLDAAWPLGALLIAAAAWSSGRRREVTAATGVRVAVVPAAAALIAIGIQAAERFSSVPPAASVLSLITLLAIVVRLWLTLRESQTSLDESKRDALSDPLTGLGNRRALMTALEGATRGQPEQGRVWLLGLFDLDGFKAYNDAYGHPAGDDLLHRLGDRLAGFTFGRGEAFRLGGDEFCLLAECTVAAVEPLLAGAGAALAERGDGFVVTASQGSVLIPSEASDASVALQLADRRMYANKRRERVSASSQTRDVLVQALHERQPALHDHLLDVAAVALRVAEQMGLDAEQRDEVQRAAELHDTGKMAIPDAILGKPGPLEPAEWEFMRKHTLIGERIIAAAPALVPVARLVRSSHERWDGDGYPDGLAGEEVPLGSRIIAVCDAYEAMVSERPYSVAMRPTRALQELERAAGSQFDPTVVSAFTEAMATTLELASERVPGPSPGAAEASPSHPR